jgi:hypothetical protein
MTTMYEARPDSSNNPHVGVGRTGILNHKKSNISSKNMTTMYEARPDSSNNPHVGVQGALD